MYQEVLHIRVLTVCIAHGERMNIQHFLRHLDDADLQVRMSAGMLLLQPGKQDFEALQVEAAACCVQSCCLEEDLLTGYFAFFLTMKLPRFVVDGRITMQHGIPILIGGRILFVIAAPEMDSQAMFGRCGAICWRWQQWIYCGCGESICFLKTKNLCGILCVLLIMFARISNFHTVLHVSISG